MERGEEGREKGDGGKRGTSRWQGKKFREETVKGRQEKTLRIRKKLYRAKKIYRDGRLCRGAGT